ncbi:MAG: winged helix-turn-helix transcriptional regulator [Candidatus Heimdallarchaeota archaeon]
MVSTMIEKVEQTPVAENLLVTSFRKSFLYGDWTKVRKVIDIHEFLLEILKLTGGITRDQLVKLTNIPRTTLYDTLKRLIEDGQVTTMLLHDGKYRGRPKTVFLGC